MKNTFAFILNMTFVLNQTCTAQPVIDNTYKWTNPFPTGNSILDLTGLKGTPLLLMSTNEGTLLQSLDEGATWDSYYFFNNGCTPQCARKLHIVNPNQLLFAGEFGLFSTDLNLSGTPQIVSLNQSSINDLQFPSPLIGYACGDNGSLIKTLDSGYTWQQIPFPTSLNLKQIVFSNDTVGLLQAYDNITFDFYFLHSINGGQSWDTILTGVPNLVGVGFSNDSTLFVYGTQIYKSMDFGNSWSLYSNPIRTILKMCVFNDSSFGAISDYFGDLLSSNNGGLTWADQNIYLQTTTDNNFYLLNDSSAFAFGGRNVLGDRASILKTTDKGNNWHYITQRVDQDDDIHDVQMFNSKDGYCQLFFHITKTLDYTNSNQEVLAAGLGEYLYGIYFTDISNGYVVGSVSGDSSFVYKTTNAGLNWSKVKLGTYEQMNDVYFATPSIGYCVGYNQTMFKTIDAGLTWYQIPTTFDGSKIEFYNAQIGFIEANNASYYITTDGGSTWNGPAFGFKNLKFLSADSLLSVYALNAVYLSTDTGATWNYLYDNPDPDFTSIIIDYSLEPDLLNGYIMSGENSFNTRGRTALYKTTDGGFNWILEPTYCGLDMNVLKTFSPDTVYMFGGFQSIVRKPYEINYNTSVSENILDGFNFIVYPNPANSYLIIKLKKPLQGKLLIQVFDISGKLIASKVDLVSEELNGLNISNIENGIYFIKVSNENILVGTQKFVINH